jgi:hypothetical protein
MHLGALVALAEVGIGINLAFGVVRQFRDWSRGVMLTATTATCASMEAALAEFRAKGQSNSVRDAVEYDKWFASISSAINLVALVLAIASSFGLFWFIYYVADHAEGDCGYFCKRAVCAAAIGPVLLSSLVIFGLYGYVRWQLRKIRKRHGELVGLLKSIDLPIQPTDPGNGSQPPTTPDSKLQ